MVVSQIESVVPQNMGAYKSLEPKSCVHVNQDPGKGHDLLRVTWLGVEILGLGPGISVMESR